jgi:hypothetical protein
MIKRVMLLGFGGLSLLWFVSRLLGDSGAARVILLAAVVAIPLVRWLSRRRCRGHWAKFGPSLVPAMSILTGDAGRRWADLMDSLGLSRFVDRRRSPTERLVGEIIGSRLGRTRVERVRYIPAVVSIVTAPFGAVVTVRGVVGQDLDLWRSRAGALASALGVPRVTITESKPMLFALQMRVADPLAESVTLAAPLRVGSGFDAPLGIGEDGRWLLLPLANQSGLVIGGVPGSGKSAWLSLFLGSFAARPDCQFLVIDGKGGHDLAELAPRAYRYVTGEEAADLAAVRDALWTVQVLTGAPSLGR